MRFLSILFLCVLLCSGDTWGIGRHRRYMGPPRNEAELVGRVLNCLSYKDSLSYYSLFPPLDTLWRMVTHNANQSPEAQKELAQLRDHPTVLIDLDPYYNHGIMLRFREVLQKGEDSGVNWKGIVLQRYELLKEGVIPGLEGLRHVIPERFRGFVFVRDMLSSTTFCIVMTDIQKVQGYFCGGQVVNVLEASSIDEYYAREAAERRAFKKLRETARQRAADSVEAKLRDTASVAVQDSVKSDTVRQVSVAKGNKQLSDSAKVARRAMILNASSVTEDDKTKIRWEVVDRKLYKGLFDDEITVELYVRYMRDGAGKVRNWDGLYKFGDMQDYIRLEISKEESKWIMEEPAGLMELELSQKIYTGTWTNGDNQTGYDVELTQKDLSQSKILKLDRILENNAGGDTRKQVIVEKTVEDTAAASVKDTSAYRDPLKEPAPKVEEKPKQKRKKNSEEKETKPAVPKKAKDTEEE